ncbi:MAG TPA: hypothetical protein VK688_09070 [Gemmatimonadales bacterium]|nr:hypothetical protein [Gemmatimonadales bacterium]
MDNPVEPAHVPLIDGLEVVADRPVVAVGVPGGFQPGRELEVFGDLHPGSAVVEHPQGLIVQVCVQVTLLGQVPDDVLGSPGRPVVGRERDIRLGSEQFDGLIEVTGPHPRVTDQSAAQREQVMQVVSGVLGHAQRPPVREVEVHLGRGLGTRRDLEDDPNPVDRFLLPREAGLDIAEADGFFCTQDPEMGFEIHAGSLAAAKERAVTAGIAAEMIDDLVATLRAAKTGGYEWVTSPFLLDLVLRKPKAM